MAKTNTTNTFTFASIKTEGQAATPCMSVNLQDKITTVMFTPKQFATFCAKGSVIAVDHRLEQEGSKIGLTIKPKNKTVGIIGYPHDYPGKKANVRN